MIVKLGRVSEETLGKIGGIDESLITPWLGRTVIVPWLRK